MFEKIVFISDNIAHIKLNNNYKLSNDILNQYIIFEDNNRRIVGEIQDISEDIVKVNF